MKKVFLIRPVMGITPEYADAIQQQREYLEKSYEVYDPIRDTPQDISSLDICTSNYVAIDRADIVFFIWDGKSKGCLFDLGMAFALNKDIRPVTGYFPNMSKGKSFANLVHELNP